MAALPELEQFDADVFQIETDSVWLGGVDGLANNQGKALANRTKWLKVQLLALLASLDDHEAAADPHPQYATDVSVAAQLNALLDGTPGALDTLNELAAALADDPNFAATINTALGLRLTIEEFQKAIAITAAAAGTADAITATYAPAIAALTNGMELHVRAASTNATTTPTFTPATGTIAAKTIVKGNNLALVAGDIAGAGNWIHLKYDLTLDKWILLNPATGVSTVTATNDGAFADNSVKPASTSWVRGAMSAIATAAGFSYSFGANGYVKFPSWLGSFIIQWVGVTRPQAASAFTNFTFPIAFPNVFLGAAIADNYTVSSAGYNNVSIVSRTSTGAQLLCTGNSIVFGSVSPSTVIAVGY